MVFLMGSAWSSSVQESRRNIRSNRRKMVCGLVVGPSKVVTASGHAWPTCHFHYFIFGSSHPAIYLAASALQDSLLFFYLFILQREARSSLVPAQWFKSRILPCTVRKESKSVIVIPLILRANVAGRQIVSGRENFLWFFIGAFYSFLRLAVHTPREPLRHRARLEVKKKLLTKKNFSAADRSDANRWQCSHRDAVSIRQSQRKEYVPIS